MGHTKIVGTPVCMVDRKRDHLVTFDRIDVYHFVIVKVVTNFDIRENFFLAKDFFLKIYTLFYGRDEHQVHDPTNDV